MIGHDGEGQLAGRKLSLAAIAISAALAAPSGGVSVGCHPPHSQTQENQQRLTAILSKARSYCQRLERAALDFVCQEEVQERYDVTREITQDLLVPGQKSGYVGTQPMPMASPAKASNKYLYDYQFVRKNQQTKEKRGLLEVNGKKSRQGSYGAPTQFQYENILFGPVGLLSDSWQPYHDYEITGEETINGEKWVVIKATLKASLGRPHAYGRIWVKEADGSVLKIAWDQKSLGNFKVIEERAKNLKAEPQVTSLSEYGFEKNGLRFPSSDSTEEAYIKKDGEKFVRADTIIIYKNYKFFTVETEITY
jgi:hypothetical protein